MADGSGGALQLIARGGPDPWQEFVDTVVGPEIDEPGQNIGEISLRVDALELARFNQRRHACPILGPAIMPGKKRVFPVMQIFA